MTRLRCLPLLPLVTSIACFDPSAGLDGSDDGSTSTDPADASSGGQADSAPASEGGDEGSTGASAEEDGGSEGDAGTDGDSGEPMSGYPPEVLEVLDLPWPLDDYENQPLPPHFLAPAVQALDNTPPGNPVRDAGATLGRVLFYDPALSVNETVACASCHRQADGFSDPATLSEGFEGGLTGRNSMGLANVRWYAPGTMFWDERAATLEEQVLMPIQDPVEMGLTLDELVTRVQSRAYYPFLFEQAFGDPEVTTDRISRALAQFVRSMIASRSRFDEGLAEVDSVTEPFAGFTPEENLGKQIFFGPAGACGVCHLTNPPPPPPGVPQPNQAIFQLDTAANNGLDLDTSADEGVGGGAFKSPSLRNVALTGPYMHDGRFETLAQVVDHYDSGVQPHPQLDPRLRNPDDTPKRLNLTPEEKAALVAFMQTLTDPSLLEDPKLSDPFR